jgi:hypothetical protein
VRLSLFRLMMDRDEFDFFALDRNEGAREYIKALDPADYEPAIQNIQANPFSLEMKRIPTLTEALAEKRKAMSTSENAQLKAQAEKDVMERATTSGSKLYEKGLEDAYIQYIEEEQPKARAKMEALRKKEMGPWADLTPAEIEIEKKAGRYPTETVHFTPIYENPLDYFRDLGGGSPLLGEKKVKQAVRSWEMLSPEHQAALRVALSQTEAFPGKFPVAYHVTRRVKDRPTREMIVHSKEMTAKFNEQFPKTAAPLEVSFVRDELHHVAIKDAQGKTTHYEPERWRYEYDDEANKPGSKERLEAFQKLVEDQGDVWDEGINKVYSISDPHTAFSELAEDPKRLTNLVQQGLETAVYRHTGSTAGDIFGQMLKAGFPVGLVDEMNVQSLGPMLTQIDPTTYMMTDPVLTEKISELKRKAIEAEFGQGLASLRPEADWTQELKKDAYSYWMGSRRAQASGLMGISPRYQGINIISWPLIMMATNPGFVWRTMKTAATKRGPTFGRAVTEKFGGRAPRQIGLFGGKPLTEYGEWAQGLCRGSRHGGAHR